MNKMRCVAFAALALGLAACASDEQYNGAPPLPSLDSMAAGLCPAQEAKAAHGDQSGAAWAEWCKARGYPFKGG